ncbi:MAG TPA: hypothetical protein VNL18_05485, partial [Gemmatimonadales bacterium]|nr:hypothetical protein [Gemmatimonadales bacterium]
MGLEDLVQLLIALAVLFGLFGGGKKKKPPEAEQPRQRRPREVRRPEAPRTTRVEVRDRAPRGIQPTRRPVESREPQAESAPPELLADEIYRILSGEVERRREESLEVETEGESLEIERGRPEFTVRAPVEDIRSIEQVTEAEAYSLETLEPAGGASHKAFHAKYMERPAEASPAAQPEVPPVRRTRRLALDARSARQAMLW